MVGCQYPILSDKEGLARKSYNVNRGLLGLTASSESRTRHSNHKLSIAIGRVTFLIGVDGAIRYRERFEMSQGCNV